MWGEAIGSVTHKFKEKDYGIYIPSGLLLLPIDFRIKPLL